MNAIKDFLLQLALVSLTLFTYPLFCSKLGKWFQAILWGVALLLCMSFPTLYGDGYHLDIRIVPLLLGFLYGGARLGAALSGLLLLYRLFLGMDTGFYNSVLAVGCSYPLLAYAQPLFRKAVKRTKIRIAILMSFLYAVIGITWFWVLRGNTPDNLLIQTIHVIFIALVTGGFVALHETIQETRRLRSDSDRFRMLSEFTSLFAHEIRNPMQTARGFLQLLDDPELPERKKQYIRLSIEELDRANGIITDLLSMAKPSTEGSRVVDAGAEARRVLNLIEPYAQTHNVQLTTRLEDGCLMLAHPQKLNQLLLNLLKNAIESMPDGGALDLTCWTTRDGKVEFVVKDEGIGMSKEQIAKLGSPFYSLKENGTGLGLMVCFQIIRQFDGEVQVTSERNAGTTFTLQFPGARQ